MSKFMEIKTIRRTDCCSTRPNPDDSPLIVFIDPDHIVEIGETVKRYDESTGLLLTESCVFITASGKEHVYGSTAEELIANIAEHVDCEECCEGEEELIEVKPPKKRKDY